MRKWYFFKTTAMRPDPEAATQAARVNSGVETPGVLKAAAEGSGARGMKGRIAGWYRSLVRRRPDRGAGAE
ncbi:MAG: hypothetical protein J7599_24090 [Niabella sp.]|nr:hypothetical protein [Niabella sp.]